MHSMSKSQSPLYGRFTQTIPTSLKWAPAGSNFPVNTKKDIYDIWLTYSWYEVTDNKVASTTIPGEDDLMLGSAAHKVSLYASVNPWKDFYITPTVTYYSPRYSLVDGDNSFVYGKIGSSMLTNISLLKKNAFGFDGMDLSFSVYNMFDEDFKFIQHNTGDYGSGPTPGPSRTFIATLSYDF